MTQEQLGEAVGVSQAAIQKWEAGEVPKRWRHYKAVCEALDCEPVDLLAIDAKMTYDWLVLTFKTALLGEDSLEIARLSKQVLDWTRFFTVGTFLSDGDDPDELANSSEIERTIAEMFRKP